MYNHSCIVELEVSYVYGSGRGYGQVVSSPASASSRLLTTFFEKLHQAQDTASHPHFSIRLLQKNSQRDRTITRNLGTDRKPV